MEESVYNPENSVYYGDLQPTVENITRDNYVAVSEATTREAFKARATDCLCVPYHTGVALRDIEFSTDTIIIAPGNNLGPPNFTKSYKLPGSAGGVSDWTLYEGYWIPPSPGVYLLDFNFLILIESLGLDVLGEVVITAHCRTSQFGSVYYSSRGEPESMNENGILENAQYGGVNLQVIWEERNPDASTYMSFDIHNGLNFNIRIMGDTLAGLDKNTWTNSITATLISK